MFDIKFTRRAVDDLKAFPESEQRWILAALENELGAAAAVETDDRQRWRPEQPVEWAVRLGNVRIYYDVDMGTRIVKIEAVGKELAV